MFNNEKKSITAVGMNCDSCALTSFLNVATTLKKQQGALAYILGLTKIAFYTIHTLKNF